jgi:hypothetical protein
VCVCARMCVFVCRKCECVCGVSDHGKDDKKGETENMSVNGRK